MDALNAESGKSKWGKLFDKAEGLTATLNVALLVISTDISRCSSCTSSSGSEQEHGFEFNVGGLAIVSGELMEVSIYNYVSKTDPLGYERLKKLFTEGTVVFAENVYFEICTDILRLFASNFVTLVNLDRRDAFVALIEELKNEKTDTTIVAEDSQFLRGFIVDREWLQSEKNGFALLVRVKTAKSLVVAVFFPKVFRRFDKMLLIKDEVQFRGKYQPEPEYGLRKFVVDFMAPYGRVCDVEEHEYD